MTDRLELADIPLDRSSSGIDRFARACCELGRPGEQQVLSIPAQPITFALRVHTPTAPKANNCTATNRGTLTGVHFTL